VQTINTATNTVINTVPAGTGPTYSDIDLRAGLLYVQNQDGNVFAFRTSDQVSLSPAGARLGAPATPCVLRNVQRMNLVQEQP
jgi:DNA-binding beta-propeller fold protein YncE